MVLQGKCTLGWQETGSSTFHAGPSPNTDLNNITDPNARDVFQVAVENPNSSSVTLDWISVSFYLKGQNVGQQTVTLNVPDTINQGGTDSSWGGVIVPNEATGNRPANSGSAPIENTPGTSCQLSDWGNASGANGG
jgi:hypothetical protein